MYIFFATYAKLETRSTSWSAEEDFANVDQNSFQTFMLTQTKAGAKFFAP